MLSHVMVDLKKDRCCSGEKFSSQRWLLHLSASLPIDAQSWRPKETISSPSLTFRITGWNFMACVTPVLRPITWVTLSTAPITYGAMQSCTVLSHFNTWHLLSYNWRQSKQSCQKERHVVQWNQIPVPWKQCNRSRPHIQGIGLKMRGKPKPTHFTLKNTHTHPFCFMMGWKIRVALGATKN